MEAAVSLPLLTNQMHRVEIVEEISGHVLTDSESNTDAGVEVIEIRNSSWPIVEMLVWSGRYRFVVNHVVS